MAGEALSLYGPFEIVIAIIESRMNIVLISTYELGRQPFGLASPAAWLRARGHDVACMDLTRSSLDEAAVRAAGLIAFYVPMHTATRLAAGLIDTVREMNPRAHLCFYGLYAPVNEEYLRRLGVGTILGGEFEEGLVSLAERLQNGAADGNGNAEQAEPVISLARQRFLAPDRSLMPELGKYARIVMPSGEQRVAGSTEATRGCKHLCRHCPIVPVYNGAFRVIERDVVLQDIRQQVAAGAQHITFGDPDFFNGPAHALAIVEALRREFPSVSYDVTVKIEHLRKHDSHLATLRDTGCLFVTTAVESVDDAVLERLAKGHTRADFLAVVAHFRELGLVLQPTFVPFTPWTTLESYRDLLTVLVEQDLLENIAPIQLGIRLLVPAGSRMLELADMRAHLGEFDGASLYHTWKHRDPRVDALAARVQEVAAAGDKLKRTRTETFVRIWEAAAETASGPANALADLAAASSLSPTIIPPISTVHAQSVAARWRLPAITARPAIPHFTEPWYCCAEPTKEQFISIGATRSRPDARAGAQPSGAPPRRSEKNVSRELSQLGARADAFL